MNKAGLTLLGLAGWWLRHSSHLYTYTYIYIYIYTYLRVRAWVPMTVLPYLAWVGASLPEVSERRLCSWNQDPLSLQDNFTQHPGSIQLLILLAMSGFTLYRCLVYILYRATNWHQWRTNSTNIYIYTYIYMFTYMCVYIHLFARAHTHTHTYVYVYIYIYICP